MPPRPATLESRDLYVGTSWVIELTLKADGAALDLSQATVDVSLRLKLQGTNSATTITRSTDNAGETEFVTDGSDGGIRFLYSDTETSSISPGSYDVDLVYEDTSTTPNTKTLHAKGNYSVLDPDTGTL